MYTALYGMFDNIFKPSQFPGTIKRVSFFDIELRSSKFPNEKRDRRKK